MARLRKLQIASVTLKDGSHYWIVKLSGKRIYGKRGDTMRDARSFCKGFANGREMPTDRFHMYV